MELHCCTVSHFVPPLTSEKAIYVAYKAAIRKYPSLSRDRANTESACSQLGHNMDREKGGQMRGEDVGNIPSKLLNRPTPLSSLYALGQGDLKQRDLLLGNTRDVYVVTRNHQRPGVSTIS